MLRHREGSDIVGAKRYELSNHLGNVLAVISDRKWGVDDGVYNTSTGVKTSSTADGAIDYYLPTIIAYSDYDPFGTIQDGRKGGASDYRYGFQGQEQDDELKGEGNSVNYEYRMHDPRIGRFFAVDPLSPKYPYYSPYQFSGNRPIDCVELEGLEPANYKNRETGETLFDAGDYSQRGESFTLDFGNGEIFHWDFVGFYNGSETEAGDEAGNTGGETETTTDDGWSTMSDNTWSPNYGVMVDQNGWPMQDWNEAPHNYSFDGNELIVSIGHGFLEGMGAVPGLGEPFDLLNAAWYAAEGDYENAAYSTASAVPFVGWSSNALKYTRKAIKYAETSPAPNYVYRALAEGEDYTKGLIARKPFATIDPISHVAGKKNSQWISTTKDPLTALNKYNSGNGVVRIDLNKINSQVIDLSQGMNKRGMLNSWMKKDQEVLIDAIIPSNAMMRIDL